MIKRREEAFVEGRSFIIENVYVDWASVFKPNTRYRPEWSVQIRVPDNLVQEFFDVGFRLKQQQDGTYTLRCRRYCRLDNGDELSPPIVVDADNNPWHESRGLIGNGSFCNVMVRAKYTTYQNIEGLSCYLEGLQIKNLVAYGGGGPTFGATSGDTAGYGGFTPQQQQPPVQQPPQPPVQQQPPVAPPLTFGQQPVPPQAPAPVQQQYVPQPVQPPAEPWSTPAEQPPVQNPAVPEHLQPQPVPTGPPAGGNVSPPPAQQGALFNSDQAPEEPQHQDPTALPPHSMGSDVPF